MYMKNRALRFPLVATTTLLLAACGVEDPTPSGAGGAGAVAGTSGTGGTSMGAAGMVGAGAGSAGMATGGTGGAGGAAVAGATGDPVAGAANGGAAGETAGAASGGTSGAEAAGAAGDDAGGAGGAEGGAAGAGDEPALPPIDDYTAQGPFSTTVEMGQGPGGNYTVFRPEPLGEDGFLHAPIMFGPGIGQSVNVHTQMLTNFASHGFVVVGSPTLNGGPGAPDNLQKMEDGLDWVLAQNEAGGQYEGKLAVDKAISMGFSVGGTSAVQLGGHAAVATVVSIHGHGAMADLHGPMLQTTGTGDTVGMPLQQQTYSNSQVQTFLATLTGAPHPYIESNGGGEERPAILAWMRYWIYNDNGARDYFFGDDCVLCKAPWENPQRKNWEE